MIYINSYLKNGGVDTGSNGSRRSQQRGLSTNATTSSGSKSPKYASLQSRSLINEPFMIPSIFTHEIVYPIACPDHLISACKVATIINNELGEFCGRYIIPTLPMTEGGISSINCK